MLRPDQVSLRITLKEMPFAKKGRRIPAHPQLIRDGPRLSGERIEIITHSILRRRDRGQHRSPGKGAERMWRHGLRIVDGLRRQGIEMGRARIGIAGVTRGLGAPLRGDNPQNVGRWCGHDVVLRSTPGPDHHYGSGLIETLPYHCDQRLHFIGLGEVGDSRPGGNSRVRDVNTVAA